MSLDLSKYEGRKCAECGVSFKPCHANSKYCSRPCAWKNNGKSNVYRRKPEGWTVSQGYIIGRVWIDENTQLRVRQHRWIMEKHLGRKLLSNEDVHHKDGNKQNNTIENLEVIDHSLHGKIHGKSARSSTRGRKLNISPEERANRSRRMKEMRRQQALTRKDA